MQIKQLFQDEDAVSPVIGVILMVAITVILAAVIGTFVLGLGDQVQSSAPNANFQFEYPTDNAVSITHNGGQDVEKSNVIVQIAGTEAYSSSSFQNTYGSGTDAADNWQSTISTGQTLTLDDGSALPSGDVLVIWESPNGDSSNTIGESTVPN